MNLRIAPLVPVLLATAAFAADPPGRAQLIGTWKQDAASEPAVWVLETKGDALHVTESQGTRKVSEFECNTVGKECEIKNEHLKVSLYYNGPKLVELETRGSDVVKRLFSPAGTDSLEIEVTSLVPAGKPEKITLKRVDATQAAATR